MSATIASDNTLTYSLSGTDASSFAIVSTTGQLKTSAALDYETKNSYAVKVTATDSSTTLSDSIDVTIDVTDVNEPPVFADDSVTLSVDENTISNPGIGKNVGDPIIATDPDANTTLRYSLGGSNAGKFKISRSTGQIKTGEYLNYEKKKRYSVKVIASDNGTPKKTGSIDVTIDINDVLDRSKALSQRTSEVKDAIVAALSEVSSADDVNDTHLASITSLSLRNGAVDSLKASDFAGLSALETLKLDGNSLTSLPEFTFNGLSALKELDLSSNSITSLRDDIFEDLPALTDLDLSSNSLSSFPHPGSILFFDLVNLENLDLSSNSFTSLPSNVFFKTQKLTHIDLSSNSLSSLPGSVFAGLTKLEDLNVSNNLLTSLPDGLFKGLSSLDRVRFAGNTTDPLTITVQVENVGSDAVVAVKTGIPAFTTAVMDIQKGTGHYVNGNLQTYGNRVRVYLEVGETRSKVVNIMRTPGETNPVLAGIYRDPHIDDKHTGIKYVKFPLYKQLFDVEEGVATAQAPKSGQQIPDVTVFLPNYPNPFNPETWIPFSLAKPADVTLTIFNMRGVVVRELVLGYQPAGYYQTRARAAYWNGRNTFGEKVATGVYFCTFKAGDFTATRKMLIRK